MIGILGALHEEVLLLKENMHIEAVHHLGGRDYYEGTLFGQRIVLVLSNIGKVAVSITATLLIDHFDIDYVLFIGVAGAGNSFVKIGDVVVADFLLQHDVDVRPFYNRHEVAILNKALFAADEALAHRLLSATKTFFSEHLSVHVDPKTLEKFSVYQPQAHLATIASGDQFIQDATVLRDIHDRIWSGQNVILGCVEMEGAAVAQVCYELNKPCVVLRTISDNANHSASIDFQAFLKEVSSQYALGIVECFFKNL
ncbi:MAG: 5'-methylthioadenosine/adenosylhomocysteine nucleosidase [Gammaproteobacteria bacterium]|nr:5'-methylthioadenosine/adenosylhomocysteine nucleosidase [Gammaproteobacteria bacterium]